MFIYLRLITNLGDSLSIRRIGNPTYVNWPINWIGISIITIFEFNNKYDLSI